VESMELNGQQVLLNIVNHDSGEDPESSCVNLMISIRLGDKTYHRLATDQRDISAIVRSVAADAQLRHEPLPNTLTLTVIVTSFAKAFDIDWPAAIGLPKSEATANMTPANSRNAAQLIVDNFNRIAPVGTQVTYLKSQIEGRQITSVVKPAYIQGDATPIVVLHGIGNVLISKVELL